MYRNGAGGLDLKNSGSAQPGDCGAVMEKVLGAFFVVIALFSFASAAVPSLRDLGQWEDTDVCPGALSHVGFGLVFGAGGALVFLYCAIALPQRVWFAVPMLLGFLAITIGRWLDFRR